MSEVNGEAVPNGTTDLPPADQPLMFVVGVGASAGGLEALERLFEKMPTDTGMAFVVVQHLSPDFKSLTDDILGRRTDIPTHQVQDGVTVQPNAIYLLPPKKEMIISGGKLLLTDKDPGQGLTLPIDHFFRSLASDQGVRAVGIILSGTGSDGSRGIQDIHKAGGLVIAQRPESAKFDGMPRSAIDTNMVDLVLTPEEIPDAVLRHASTHTDENSRSRSDLSPAVGVDAVFRLLRDAYGIDFSQYKSETVARRLERRLAMSDATGVDEYAQKLATDPAELNRLYKDLLIGVTRFFRDEEAFQKLGRDVLPELIERLAPDEDLRIWVVGCATGEEAYSLAILILEAVGRLNRPVPTKIFATDVHRASLEIAGAGYYPEEAIAEIGPERLTRFFTRVSGGYQVSPELRKLIVFAPHNVIKDAPFKKLDLITCRNLLIYFQPQAQKRVLSVFHFGLKHNGILFLGPSESPGEITDEFETLDARWKIYRKRRDIRLPPDLRMSAIAGLGLTRPTPIQPLPTSDPSLISAYDALLDKFMPAGILVNERREMIQSFGGASKYLKLRDGRATNDVLEMVDHELRMALTGSLPRAFKELTNVVYKGLRVHPAEGERIVNVLIDPVRNRRGGVSYAIIQIEEVAAPVTRDAPREVRLDEASRDHVLALEQELRYTKENLQAMIEEMETSNEELQSTNEELVAANEELQSTNEELQSVNEELYTVNAEYQKKISELTELTTDMDNLLASTEVHTIFLDQDLCIRKFTPTIAETFSLMPQDVGRRIDNFTYSIDHAGLLGDLRAVLATGKPTEHQVRNRKGVWFLLRVLPYRAGLQIKGVVLTLIDLTRVKRVEAEARLKDSQLTSILQHSPNWVFLKDLTGRYVLVDESFREAVGCDPVGKTPHDVFPKEVADVLVAGDQRVIKQGFDDDTEVVIERPDGPHTYLWAKFPLRDADGNVTGVGGITTDITGVKHAERTARDTLLQRERFLAMLSHELRNPLAAVVNSVLMLRRIGLSAPSAGEWFDVIDRRTRHMSRLLDDLLDVARVTSDKFEMRRETFDLRDTVPHVMEEVRPLFAQERVELTGPCADGALPVFGDATRLVQVQVNLLVNAAKYTPAGGRVCYALERDGQQAVIRVRDTGVGLDPEMLGKVFEPFVQADETLDRAGGGIGLGLTLVRSIVELHNGTVDARSQGVGEGSEFVVRLPLDSRPGATPMQPATGAPSAAKPLRVLVVEDDADIRKSVVGLLELDGYSVRAVADGEAALAALAEQPADVAVVDIGLPRINGYDLARRIRADSSLPRIRLIALTGYGQPLDKVSATSAGFDEHLTKPLNPDQLTRALAGASG